MQGMHRILLIMIISLLAPIESAYSAQKITEIRVEGVERISAGTVEAYLPLHQGEIYSDEKADQAVKALYNTGFFADVQVGEHGGILTIKVKENPLVNKIAFEGNHKVEDADLLHAITMTERSIYSTSQVQSDLQKLFTLYRKHGRSGVQITPKLIQLDQHRVNLVYEIDEGGRSYINNIVFLGNKRFSNWRLQRVIASKEKMWYRFFSSVDTYDQDRVALDQELLRRFYMERGYADFAINSVRTEAAPGHQSYIMTFALYEGEEYTHGSPKIESAIKGLDTKALEQFITFSEGKTFDITQVEETVDRITNYLGDHGYAFADVDYRVNKDAQKHQASITFTINETYKVYVNRINIKNNTRTLDKVVRREFRIAEGDPYNISKIQRSRQRLQNLGFFKSVELRNVRTQNADRLDIDVEVEETSTGSINFGAGYNTMDGPLAMVALSETNFLGKGQQVDINASKAQRALDLSFGFTEPYFLDMPLAAGFDIFSTSKDRVRESSYKIRANGGVLRFGYELTEYLYHGIRYNLKQENIFDVSSDASALIKSQAGKNTVSSVGHTLTYDRLDDRADPREGYILKLTQDLAGVGGQTHYFESKITAAYYYPLYKKDVIVGITGKAGHILPWNGEKIRLSDRFFMGSDEVRGFAIAGVGPRDTASGDSLGGHTFYVSNLEVSFPLGLPEELSVRGVAFADAGSLFGLSLKPGESKANIVDDRAIRTSAGLGIIWNSSLGRLRFDYGWPITKGKGDKSEHLRFFIGTNF
ncbi:MAG: outer membrane protein assembly factor BamA [Proteobacteria bacterium]|nr:outer membrane protein assembly factor BamA [Pseudomonadota bacterium]